MCFNVSTKERLLRHIRQAWGARVSVSIAAGQAMQGIDNAAYSSVKRVTKVSTLATRTGNQQQQPAVGELFRIRGVARVQIFRGHVDVFHDHLLSLISFRLRVEGGGNLPQHRGWMSPCPCKSLPVSLT